MASWLTTNSNIRLTAPNLLKTATTAKYLPTGNSILRRVIPILSNRLTVHRHLHIANTDSLLRPMDNILRLIKIHTEGVRRR